MPANRRAFENWWIGELESDGWQCDRAVMQASYIAGKFRPMHHDFFGCFDLIACRGNEVNFWQVTSIDYTGSASAHRGQLDPTRIVYRHMRRIDEAFQHNLPVGIVVYMKDGSRWNRKNRRIYRRTHPGKWRIVEAQTNIHVFRRAHDGD